MKKKGKAVGRERLRTKMNVSLLFEGRKLPVLITEEVVYFLFIIQECVRENKE
jgi:hypothetical protein